jgi:aspartate racemase
LRTLLPTSSRREALERIIFQELALGRLEPDSRRICLDMAEELAARGAQAVILGCTELPLLLKGWPAPVPWLDTLELHVRAAVELAVG